MLRSLDTGYDVLRPIIVDHLFAAVQRAGLTGGISGFHWWKKLVPQEQLYTSYYTAQEGDVADRAVVSQALVFMQEFEPNLLCVNLRQAELAGHTYGADSREYLSALGHCDDQLRTLAEGLDLEHTILIVTSSHGLLDSGALAGMSRYCLRRPW